MCTVPRPVRLAAGSVLLLLFLEQKSFALTLCHSEIRGEIPKQNHYNLRFHLTEEGITNEKTVSSTYFSILLHWEYSAQNVIPYR